MIYILVAIAFFIIGNISPKISVEQFKSDNKMPGHRNAPPPPPIIKTKNNHIKPGFSYNSDTFVIVNECENCNAIGREYDMFRMNPCPRCGGNVVSSGAAKWGVVDGQKQWIRPAQ